VGGRVGVRGVNLEFSTGKPRNRVTDDHDRGCRGLKDLEGFAESGQ
jgi:hypothetical protein